MVTKRQTPPPNSVKPLHWQGPVALLVVALVVLGLLLGFAERWVRWGLVGHVWYVVVLCLGVFVAWVCFLLADSYATYKGKVWGGQLRVGGPAVVAIAVCVLGFVLAPKAVEKFDVTVFLQAPASAPKAVSELEPEARVLLRLGADLREERVGSKGVVRFVGVPADLLDSQAELRLEGSLRYGLAWASRAADGVQAAAGQALTVTLGKQPLELVLLPQRTTVFARVLDGAGQPVAHARWHVLAGGEGESGADGTFQVELLVHTPEAERELTVQAPGYAMWRGTVVPHGGVLTVQLVSSVPQ